MLRACRLVIDTGLHARAGGREQSISTWRRTRATTRIRHGGESTATS
jgi:uncharacterized protein (DUF885 family)